MRGGLAVGLVLGAVACNGVESSAILASPTNADASVKPKPIANPEPDEKADGEAKASADAPGWVTATRSPWIVPHEEGRDPREIALAALCGTEDAALTRV